MRTRLRELAERETAVAQEFSKNIRDGVRSVSVEPASLDGLPADFVESHPAGDDGLVVITTDYPDYLPFSTFSRDRAARAALVQEYLNRAWPENDALLHELLELRREHARLLGYDGWPSYDAEVKMIGKGAAIPEFIERITEVSTAAARRDIEILLSRVQQDHPEVTAVDSVDKAFYSEVLRRERFDVDAQQVRTYFDFAKVRAGLLEVTGRLFDVEYVEVTDTPRWHEDVTTYDVLRGGTRLGRIRLDLHPRAGKYGHAAQFDLAPGIAGRQVAEGVLVCNFSQGPDGARPRRDAVPRVRSPAAPRAGRRAARGPGSPAWPPSGTSWRRRPRCSRSGPGTPTCCGPSRPTRRVSRSRASWWRGCGRPRTSATGCYARTQMFYAALSYTHPPGRARRHHRDDAGAPGERTTCSATCRTPTSSRRSATSRATARATTPTCGAW